MTYYVIEYIDLYMIEMHTISHDLYHLYDFLYTFIL